jgi:hypothetical protein
MSQRNRELDAIYFEWTQKLEDSGFKDLEERVDGKWILKQESGSYFRFRRLAPSARENRAHYFSIIVEAADKIQDPVEREILQLYGHGHNQVEIQQKLSKKLHRVTIYKLLKKWLRAWGLK